MEYEYDTIINLAKKHNYKKIMIMRNSWNNGNWCIVNQFKYGHPFGHIHYADGNTYNGSIPCPNTYAWRVIKILEDDIEMNGY